MPRGRPKKTMQQLIIDAPVDNSIEIINKYVGYGMRLGNDPILTPEFIPSGISSLDNILGGGIPRNRVSIFLGDYATGKTFLCQKIIESCQKQGGVAAFIDAEMKMDPDWFLTTGVDIKNLLVFQNNIGEKVLDLCIKLVSDVDLLIVDSLPSLVPMAEEKAGMEQSFIAVQARMITKFFIKLLPHLNKESGSRCSVVFINHIKTGIGGFIPVESYPGGKAQKYYAAIILRVARHGWATVPAKFGSKEVKKRIGFDIVCKTEKNSLASPFRLCSIPFSFDGTVDVVRSLGRSALDEGLILQSGPYYQYKDLRVKGRAEFITAFRERKDLQEQMESELVQTLPPSIEEEEENE